MTVYDAIILGYRLALGALLVLILLKGTGPMKRTVITMLAVYLAQLGLAEYLWPGWHWSAAVAGLDALACRIVTWHPAGRWQSVIGFTFLLQFGIHAGRIIAELNGKLIDLNDYWWLLTLLAFLQILLVGGWLSDDYRLSRNNSRRLDHPTVAPVHRGRLGP